MTAGRHNNRPAPGRNRQRRRKEPAAPTRVGRPLPARPRPDGPGRPTAAARPCTTVVVPESAGSDLRRDPVTAGQTKSMRSSLTGYPAVAKCAAIGKFPWSVAATICVAPCATRSCVHSTSRS